MLCCMRRGIKSTVKATRMKVDMNLSFPRISEQEDCGSSGPIGIGALDEKFSHFDRGIINMRRKSSFTRQFMTK